MSKLGLFLILLSFSGLDASTQEFVELAKNLHEECNKQSPISSEVVTKVKKDAVMDENDEALKKHVLCLAKKAGLVDDEANVQYKLIRANLNKMGMDEDLMNKVIEYCKKVEKVKDNALYVLRMHNCYFEKIPAEYIIF